MSAMDGNQHYAVATTVSVEDGAEVEATLALAYEQRTANLVAVLTAGFESVKIAGVDYTKLADTIQQRLGL